jgi:hypothetical protein
LLAVLIVRVADAAPQPGGVKLEARLVVDSANQTPSSSTIIGPGSLSSGESVELSFDGRSESVAADRIRGDDPSLKLVRIAGLEPDLAIGPEVSVLLVVGASLIPIAIAIFWHLRRHIRRR